MKEKELLKLVKMEKTSVVIKILEHDLRSRLDKKKRRELKKLEH